MMAVLFSLNLAMLSGCGPAVSDHSPSQESRASLTAQSDSQPVSQHIPSQPNALSTPAASGAPPASNPQPAALQENPTPMPEHLVMPIWIAQALDAPEASVRIQALDLWAQQGAQAPLDPLVAALDDENDEVRTRAMEIIEQQWAIDQEADPEAAK
jgi:hypothetical protein